MKQPSIILPLLLAILLAACGPQDAPTPDLAAVQASAVAAASTMIAMTKAAIPPTPVPSPTAPPSLTPLPPQALPTLAIPTSAPFNGLASATSDPCTGLLPAKPRGPGANIGLYNNSSAQATISIYVNLTNLGDCGFRGYSLPQLGSTLITDIPQACYFVAAFINDPAKPRRVSGSGCSTNPQRIYIVISNAGVSFTLKHP
jgi:hypothetical protein